MSEKIQKLKEFMQKQYNYFKGEYKKTENIKDHCKEDMFRLMLTRLDNTGWDKTYEYSKQEYQRWLASTSGLGSLFAGAYKQIMDKMFSLNRKCDN